MIYDFYTWLAVWPHWRGSYGQSKGPVFNRGGRISVRHFPVIFHTKWLLWNVHVRFDCAGSHKMPRADKGSGFFPVNYPQTGSCALCVCAPACFHMCVLFCALICVLLVLRVLSYVCCHVCSHLCSHMCAPICVLSYVCSHMCVLFMLCPFPSPPNTLFWVSGIWWSTNAWV